MMTRDNPCTPSPLSAPRSCSRKVQFGDLAAAAARVYVGRCTACGLERLLSAQAGTKKLLEGSGLLHNSGKQQKPICANAVACEFVASISRSCLSRIQSARAGQATADIQPAESSPQDACSAVQELSCNSACIDNREPQAPMLSQEKPLEPSASSTKSHQSLEEPQAPASPTNCGNAGCSVGGQSQEINSGEFKDLGQHYSDKAFESSHSLIRGHEYVRSIIVEDQEHVIGIHIPHFKTNQRSGQLVSTGRMDLVKVSCLVPLEASQSCMPQSGTSRQPTPNSVGLA